MPSKHTGAAITTFNAHGSSLPIIIGLSTAITTYTGGWFAMRWQNRIHWLLAYGAGAVLGVALFDLFPEALELSSRTLGDRTVMGLVCLGFLLCLLLYRLMPAHTHTGSGKGDRSESKHHEPDFEPNNNTSKPNGGNNLIAAGSLTLHSLLDGVGIGLALKVSLAVGLIAAVGVLIHDFSDGINTVAIVLRNNGRASLARKWLAADSAAPLAGIIAAQFISLSSTSLGAVLAVFCGMFCYIGGFDLLPEGYRRHTPAAATLLAVLGAGTVFVAVALARM